MSRTGVALPVLLLLVLALAALSHGVLVLAQDALRSARAGAAVAQARVAAEVGVVEASSSWAGWSGSPLAMWDARTAAEGGLGARARYRVRLRSLGPEFRLLEGEGRVEPEGVTRRVARVVWTLDPVVRVGAALAAAEVGGRVRIESGSTVSGHGVDLFPDGWPPGVCDPYRQALDSLFPARLIPATASLPVADRPRPGTGLLSLDTLLTRADVTLGPTARVSPAPEVEDGACVAAPSNWGDPGDPSGPCGGRLPLVAATGSLVMEGGEGQGILAVAGDLRVAAGARFAGVVLVAGRLEVDGAARIEGLARMGGDLDVRGGGTIAGRGCPALRALEAAPGLREPILPAAGSWLSPL